MGEFIIKTLAAIFIFFVIPSILVTIFDGKRLKELERRKKISYDIEKKREEQKQKGKIPPIFENYDDYLRSNWWKNLRDHTLNWVKHTCEFCGMRANQIHHTRYLKKYNWGRETITSLVAVCEKCHEILHGKTKNKNHNSCAFCGSPAKWELKIKVNKHASTTPINVCFKCRKLSDGYRDSAYGWSDEKYAEWIKSWSESIPVVKPDIQK